MSVIKLDHVSYVYSKGTPFEKTAVDDVSLEIEKGEFVGVIGHTGSGKSTLMQHLNALLEPTSGKVYIDGEDVWPIRRMSGGFASRWGWCSSIRSTSSLRKPSTKMCLRPDQHGPFGGGCGRTGAPCPLNGRHRRAGL